MTHWKLLLLPLAVLLPLLAYVAGTLSTGPEEPTQPEPVILRDGESDDERTPRDDRNSRENPTDVRRGDESGRGDDADERSGDNGDDDGDGDDDPEVVLPPPTHLDDDRADDDDDDFRDGETDDRGGDG